MNANHYKHGWTSRLYPVLGSVWTVCLLVNPSWGQVTRCVDWTSLPSTFTHDEHARRVDQFQTPVEPRVDERADFERSGYRNYRSSIQSGSSADNFHVVEQWGNQVRPYDEWRFPFRPYSVPYDQWGQQPVLGVVPGYGGLGYAAPGTGYPYSQPPYAPQHIPGYPGNMYPPNPWPGNLPIPNRFSVPGFRSDTPTGQAPWVDGYWPHVNDPVQRDQEFFQIPRS